MENIGSDKQKVESYRYVKRNYFELASKQEEKEIFDFAENYKEFMTKCKTEREVNDYVSSEAMKYHFSEYSFGDLLKVGDKKFISNRGKGIVLFKIGENDIEKEGLRIIVSHLDSPRLDLKQVPIYESDGLCFFKTHYYGGIKKYQWTAMPLSIHGVVFTKDNKKININIGDDVNDPVFYINDLLPHLGKSQMELKANDFINGEQLNIVVGGKALKDEQLKDKIKENVLQILYNEYHITEEDFISAELSIVPALPPRDIGFDRSLLGAYGHDDKVCAYASLKAIVDSRNKNTVICILVDKEEIGSEGVTGIKSKIYEDIIDEICISLKKNVRKVRQKSMCISADVTAGYDSNFADVFEKNNAAILSCGVCMNKYTGGGGKSDSNDASAELVQRIRDIFSKHNIIWQTSELGKVDIGGGGTVAKFIAQLNIDTVDIGVPVISMHAPYELISKADLYSAYKGYKAFFE